MKLELKKFGTTLSSRPLAKEAWLSTQAYILSGIAPDEKIEVDFTGVDVMTPSWADEYISSLKKIILIVLCCCHQKTKPFKCL